MSKIKHKSSETVTIYCYCNEHLEAARRTMAQTKQPPTNKEPKPSGELREEG